MKNPARQIDYERLTRKIRKRRLATFKESVQALGIQWKRMITEMEEIYGAIQSAPDLSEDEKEKVAQQFITESKTLILEWIGETQSFLVSFPPNKSKTKKDKK
jgi:hypothetical protein